ncbi:ANK3 [Symbiodinium natans]|uniref:ANK3 protein n=1 Tax=Symbiodinium natans TaxID=878477 RepID=A0A812JP65_9DINO|nr:ANK3 [Symbiodinium natans]
MARLRGLVVLLAALAPLCATFVGSFWASRDFHPGRTWKVALRATGDLVAAAGGGNAAQVTELLQSGTSPDTADANGQRPLTVMLLSGAVLMQFRIAAAGQGHIEVMERLLLGC